MRSSSRAVLAVALLGASGCSLFRSDPPPRDGGGGPPVDASGVDAAGPDAATPPARDAGLPPGVDGGPVAPGPRWQRYIRGDADPRLVIEIDSVAGAEPRAGAEADLVAALEPLLDKPGGIEIVHDDVIPSRGADHAWTFAELGELTRTFFDDAEYPPGTVAMHVMWIDGHDEADSRDGVVLGLAWSNTHIAMYQNTIEDVCRGSLISGEEVCREAQYLVWLHEVGHTIGLVDNGLPMVSNHRDAEHGRHDTNQDCVMYWAFDGASGISMLRDRLLGGGSVPTFDDECRADIAAVRDR